MQTDPGLILVPIGPVAVQPGPSGPVPGPQRDGFALLLDAEPSRPAVPQGEDTGRALAETPLAWGGAFWPAVSQVILPAPPVTPNADEPLVPGGSFEAAAPTQPTDSPASPSPLVGGAAPGAGLSGAGLSGDGDLRAGLAGAVRRSSAPHDGLHGAAGGVPASGAGDNGPVVPPDLRLAGTGPRPERPASAAMGPGPWSSGPLALRSGAGLPADPVPATRLGPALDGQAPGLVAGQAAMPVSIPEPASGSIAEPLAVPEPGRDGGGSGTGQRTAGQTGFAGLAQGQASGDVRPLAADDAARTLAPTPPGTQPQPHPQRPLLSMPDSRVTGDPAQAPVQSGEFRGDDASQVPETASRAEAPDARPEPLRPLVGRDPIQPVPAEIDAAPGLSARATGAELIWLGTLHMLDDRPGKDAGPADGKAPPSGHAPGPQAMTGPGAPLGPPVTPAVAARHPEDAVPAALDFAALALAAADRMPNAPPAPAAPTAPQAAPVPHLAAQITATLQQRPDGTTEIALSPDELGSVRLQVQPDAQHPDRVVVHLAFDRPETMDLFRRHADQLAEALRSAGYAEARLDFGQTAPGSGEDARRGPAGRHDPEADQRPAPADDRPEGVSGPDRPPPLRLSGSAGMDLRL